MQNRRDFLKKVAVSSAGIATGSFALTNKSYGRVLGSNSKITVAILGFSDRARSSLIPSFQKFADEMNFEIVAVCDIWNRRRDEGKTFFEEKYGLKVKTVRNTDELYSKIKPDAVIISTADFQHALHTVEAVKAGCDVYVEKPFAETMEDNRAALKAVKETGKIVQVGSQRRSGQNYHAANAYVKSGKFGKITMVEMTWNVNQPGRWRLPKLTASIKESDTDWKRYLMNRPYEPWDPRKYLEYRLFWPYSSGIPGQWMAHQIDTVHWFSGYDYPRSVAANGGIYVWNDGRRNHDTMTAIFDYGNPNDMSDGFQVQYHSRMHNSSGGTKEWYFSNGGKIDLQTGRVSSEGGLSQQYAEAMGMKPFLLESMELPTENIETSANTGSDSLTNNHMRNWMECVRNRKTPNAPAEAGYSHSIANIMTTAALHTGLRTTFDPIKQEVMAGDKVFKY